MSLLELGIACKHVMRGHQPWPATGNFQEKRAVEPGSVRQRSPASPLHLCTFPLHRLRRVRHALSEDGLREVAAAAHGFLGADLAALVNEAALEVSTQRQAARGHISSGC